MANGLFRGTTADRVAAEKRPPTPQELRQMAQESKAPEDYDRWKGPEGDKMLQTWINRGWDVNAGGFHTTKTDMQGNRLKSDQLLYKPDETPDGWTAYGPNNTAIPISQAQAMGLAGFGPQQSAQQQGGMSLAELGQVGGVTQPTAVGGDAASAANPNYAAQMAAQGQGVNGWNDWTKYGL